MKSLPCFTNGGFDSSFYILLSRHTMIFLRATGFFDSLNVRFVCQDMENPAEVTWLQAKSYCDIADQGFVALETEFPVHTGLTEFPPPKATVGT
jgi:hypothetical protein